MRRKRILSVLIAVAVITAIFSGGISVAETPKEVPDYETAPPVTVRLMGRDNVSWNNHEPYTSEPITIYRGGGQYTVSIDGMWTQTLVDLALREEKSNFCTGADSNCYSRNDCAFNLSPQLPDEWQWNTYIKYESVIINGEFDALSEPAYSSITGEDYPFFTGFYANAPLWNGWDDYGCLLTGVERENGIGTSFALPGSPTPVMRSIEVTFSVVTIGYCYDCGRPDIHCICCDCGICDRCTFVPCCDFCCDGFDWCEGFCGQWYFCCISCNPCGECCVCINCPGCEDCFVRCCYFCCKGFGECESPENPCNDCCFCAEPPPEVYCGDCAYCNYCRICYENPCVCVKCEDCNNFPCECMPTYLLNTDSGEMNITNIGAKSINPALIKGVRFTFDIPDLNCDGEHIYSYEDREGKEHSIQLEGCMVAYAAGYYNNDNFPYFFEEDIFCYNEKQTVTFAFDNGEVAYLNIIANSIFENDGTVLVEVLGEKGVVLKLGQQKLCSCCDERPKPGKRGHVLGEENITIFDALEILKDLVGMDGAVKDCDNALRAALIIEPKAKSPTIFDALEILKHLVGMTEL